MQKTTTISHDPFARCEVIRQKASGTCAWCGQPAKWRYGVNRDDRGRNEMQSRVFCSISCQRDFNS